MMVLSRASPAFSFITMKENILCVSEFGEILIYGCTNMGCSDVLVCRVAELSSELRKIYMTTI